MPFHDGNRPPAFVAVPVDHVLGRAKAYAALIGSVLTVLATTLPPDPTVQKWLGIALALCTAVATFAVPNKPQARR